MAKVLAVILYCFPDSNSKRLDLFLPFLQMEKGDDINIKQVLLNMRKYRMGLIQTPDQLRFSYMAIIEGAKCIKGDSNIQVNFMTHITHVYSASR
jgi:protein tyrosine phosphatase